MDRRRSLSHSLLDSKQDADPLAHATVRLYVPLEFEVRVELMIRMRGGLFGRREDFDALGWVHPPELRMQFALRSPERWRRDELESGAATISIVPAGTRLPIAAQPIDRMRPERQDLWIITHEPQRRPPWLEHYVGRCGARMRTFERSVQAAATLDVCCRTLESPSGGDVRLEAWGDLTFERPISMRLMLREGDRMAGDSTEMVAVASGTRVTMERQTVSTSVAPGTRIHLSVRDDEGRVLCRERALGQSGGCG